MAYLMKCGHVSNAKKVLKDGTSKPVCILCDGIREGAGIIDREVNGREGLEGRKAKCRYSSPKRGYTCKGEIDSEWELPFFRYQPDKPYDEYYCGCWGWD